MAKKQVMGRTLDALLVGARESSLAPKSSSSGILEVAITRLIPGRYQPRREFKQADLESLAESIRAQGILQPLVVRVAEKDNYEIIAGERRWRAAQLAGLDKVPVIVKEVSDEVALAMGLIENIQRADLSPLEEAAALERLSTEFGLTHMQVAESVGKSRVTITNLLRLLTLDEEVKILLNKGALEVGHAKVLLGVRGSEQARFAHIAASKKLSVRETERLVAKGLENKGSLLKRAAVDPDVQRLLHSLEDILGASLQIVQGEHGKGKLVIHYNSLDELDGILAHIK